ncbi:MAG: hypothetical protein KF805_11300 [Phycisphaeraceae bacterium]|nr:hypothetical protein [Phycisphaeraceae bacterium]
MPDPARTSPAALNKLPAITFSFWVMKIAATTLGETLGDFLSKGPEHGGLNLGYLFASILVLAIFFATLIPQLRSRSFHPFLYWAVILSTSTAGTTMSDFMDRTLGLGYAVGSAILIGLLVSALVIWRLVEGTISVSSVRTRRAEVFYWIAILCSNTLGTALGDYLADEEQGPGLGFMGGALLIGSAIAIIAIAYFIARSMRIANAALYVGLFWAAFVLTRPFGATFGDVLARGHAEGGLGFGPAGSSIALAIILVGVILATSPRKPARTSDIANAWDSAP